MILKIFSFIRIGFSKVRDSFVFRKFVSFFQPFTWKKGVLSFVVFIFLVGLYYRIFDDAKCLAGDCVSGLSKIEFRNGDIYEGMFVDSKPQGLGAFWSKKGDYYQGGWFRGMKHGQGKYVYPNGTEYIGDFTFNKKEGVGVFKWADGTLLKCSWINDQPQGDGVLILPDYRKFSGFYQRGAIYEGEGIFIYTDGSKYLGSWKAGQRHGFGTLVAPGGIILYRGMWAEDQRVMTNVPVPKAAEESELKTKVNKNKKKKGKKHE